MLPGTVLFSAMTYIAMWVGYALSGYRRVHVSIMVTVMLCDVGMPFYLVATRHWYKRLIVHEEIMTFLVWMHFILLITLYVLYVLQVAAGRKLWRNAGDGEVRAEHRSQAKALLVVKAMVVLTGALLVEPDAT
jgi:hypothetical protein